MAAKFKAGALTEGALMAGLTVIFILGSAYLPVVGMVFTLICGVPITIITTRRGSYMGALTALVSFLLIAMLVGPLNALAYSLQFLTMAWVFGWMFAHRKSAVKTISAGIIVSIVATVILAILSMALMGFSLDTLQAQQAAYMSEVMEMYNQMGMLEQMAEQGVTRETLEQTLAEMLAMMIKLTPAILILTGAMTAVVNYLVTVQVLKRLKIKIPRLPKVSQWALPMNAVWGLIAAWGIWLANDYISVSWVQILAENVLVVYAALLFAQGLCVCVSWFKIGEMGIGSKILLVILGLLFISGVFFTCVLLGLADLLLDFRKLRKPKESV